MHIVSVFDRAAQAYAQPVFVAATGLAIRSFGDEINRRSPDNQLSQHPEDFELYVLGSFDPTSGSITPHPQPALLVRGQDVIQSSISKNP